MSSSFVAVDTDIEHVDDENGGRSYDEVSFPCVNRMTKVIVFD